LRRQAFAALTLNPRSEAVILNAAGAIEASRRGADARSSDTPPVTDLPGEWTPISDGLDAILHALDPAVPARPGSATRRGTAAG
jgi:hypothetical protein